MGLLVTVLVRRARCQVGGGVARPYVGDRYDHRLVIHAVFQPPGSIGDGEYIGSAPGRDPLALAIGGIVRQLHTSKVVTVKTSVLADPVRPFHRPVVKAHLVPLRSHALEPACTRLRKRIGIRHVGFQIQYRRGIEQIVPRHCQAQAIYTDKPHATHADAVGSVW